MRRSGGYGFWDQPLGGPGSIGTMTTAGVLGPLIILGVFLLWKWIALAYLVALLGWFAYHLTRHYWLKSPPGRAHTHKEAEVDRRLKELRAAEFERRHGVPMPPGYGYYHQTTKKGG